MAAREAVKVIADALSANLQTKLDALSVTSGETAPTIADFRDPYSDDVLEGRDWPLVLVVTAGPTTFAAFESQGEVRSEVPIDIRYADKDRDTAQAMQRASYFARACVQVLNDFFTSGGPTRTANGVTLANLVDLTFDYTPFVLEAGETAPGATVSFGAHMIDNSP